MNTRLLSSAAFAMAMLGCNAEPVFASSQAATERPHLFYVDELDDAKIDRVTLTGVAQPYPFEVKIENLSNGQDLVISTTFLGQEHKNITLRGSAYGRIDLSTLKVTAGRLSDLPLLKIMLRFGSETECFENDDGRGRLIISYKPGSEPVLQATSYERCVGWTRDVPVKFN